MIVAFHCHDAAVARIVVRMSFHPIVVGMVPAVFMSAARGRGRFCGRRGLLLVVL
ncbi:MAG: hypothetical protein L6Q76_04595 [Polyangiaceae bacterium]|nr:hypothetical protein [Polyangiaceae bacterium]